MSKKFQYRYQLYKHLQANTANIYADCRKAGEEIGITPEMKNNIGATGAISGCHGLLSNEVSKAVEAVARKVINSAALDEELREVVKSVYGDDYDVALTNTCEGGLVICYDVLYAPPMAGRGENYRGRYIAPFERHMHHQGAYGRPFPPKYKEVNAERGEAAGELGVTGKRQTNLETVYARLAGADYSLHGIKHCPVQNLLHVDARKSIESIAELSERHEELLVGYASLAYDTAGYGYGDKNANGAPELQVGLGKLAKKYDVPYIVDNAWGVPFVGTDIRKIDADAMIYSMDKASGAPTCGMIIGKAESMVPIRRSVGIHGARYGTLSSHGKAAHVGFDPGKEALAGAIAALKILRDHPEIMKASLEGLYKIAMEEFEQLPAQLKKGWNIVKSFNSNAVELNYQDTWTKDKMGIPVFSIEDMYAGSHLLQNGMGQMGIIPTIAYDANIFISNGIGNLDEDGRLLEKETRLIVKGVLKTVEIISRYAGLLD
jgi:hypothetical protein